jgi:tRNA A-37 threonylcarbamoyl transferase component Bud32/SAM-dependent methyltransferase
VKRFTHGVAVGGRYVLDSLIASGGMGDVWRAQDTVLARVVAVKIMRPDTSAEPVFAQRFHEEALLTAGLSHHNIATLFDYGEHENLAYIVMELVDGHSLAVELRERGALDVARVRSIVGQMALGLNAAHEAGVVHRDVKPANVLLTSDGAVKLTDFGIARAAGSMGLTRTGEVLGTPHYLSPEQALGRPATAASDLYALGVVAHELLAGRRPFDKDTPIATALAHVTEPMPTLPATVPSDVVDIIGRCLSKDPAMRPASAREVASELGMSWVEIRLPRPGDGPGAHLAHQPHGIPAGASDGGSATAPLTGPVAAAAVAARRGLPQEARLLDVMVRPGSRVLEVGCRAGRVGGALSVLGHYVVGTDVDPTGIAAAETAYPDAKWLVMEPERLILDDLGESVPFDVIAWINSSILEVDPVHRSEVFRRLAMCCSPRGRIVVEFRSDAGYSYQAFRDDFLSAGLIPDVGFSGWDLRPYAVDALSTVVLLSRR